MSARANAAQEIVDYRRSGALPGVEVVDAQNSPREWRILCPDFSVVLFRTWRGGVRVRGGVHGGDPKVLFCNMPGELFVANPHAGPGSFNVITIQPQVLEQCAAEQQPGSLRLDWAGIMLPHSPELHRRFSGFFDIFEPGAAAMQLQSQLLELSELMISDLIQGAHAPRPVSGPPLRAAARMRECLNEEGLHVDLETLAQRAGLSRFQALRAFKQRYGLPPHAYQLCLRMSHARRLLVEGLPAADVALRCGFADQSHFIRHFKRLNGITPLQYARAHMLSSRRNVSEAAARTADATVMSSDR